MTGLSHSEKLRLTISLAQPYLNHLSHLFWTYQHLDELFPEYLFTLHTSMRSTVPMLEAAAARSRTLAPNDQVAARLVPYFLEHAREELHHDDWLLEDMKALGIDPATVLKRQPTVGVAQMIGAQYYWLYHAHPVTVLGCFAVLEGSPPEVETLDAVVERSGIPKASLRTLYKHAQLDPHHRDDLDRVLDDLPLAPDHVALLGTSALHAVEQLGGILSTLLAGAGHPEISDPRTSAASALK
ncbi:MAG TPA: iron-containing redox enzyme family protein [Gemmatimonadales bacterium]|nr:iron-containing redox enzyme family protein [Gemmatimonadales bacterium]